MLYHWESLDGERTKLWMHEQQSLVGENDAVLYSSYISSDPS